MEILISFSVLGGFLILGMILRAKIRFLQKIFLPASVIGGFIGLLLGPIILGDYAVVPVPDDWLSIYELLPGILIVPVVASVPFGVQFKRKFGKNKDKVKNNQTNSKKDNNLSRNILILFGILVIVSQGQHVLGIGLHYIFNKIGMGQDFYPTFGTEIGAGFAGGHGTAGVVGSILQSMNQPYWNLAQGVTVTTATIGIVSGILLGIILINFAARKGYTKYLSGPENFPENMLKGYESDVKKQKSLGKETTLSSSIDSLAFHLALIIGGSGLAYGLMTLVKYLQVPVIGSIPIWAYAIIVMYVVWWIICQLGLSWIIDNQITSKIASMFTDFAVVAAIISMPVQAVLTFIVPILIMVVVIMAFTALIAYWLSKKFFDEFWFERSVTVLGTCSGVFITGLLLLKMVDSEYQSPVLTEYSVSYSANSVLGFILFPIIFGALVNQGILSGLAIVTGVVVLAIIMILIANFKNRSTKYNKEMKVS